MSQTKTDESFKEGAEFLFNIRVKKDNHIALLHPKKSLCVSLMSEKDKRVDMCAYGTLGLATDGTIELNSRKDGFENLRRFQDFPQFMP